MQKKKKTKFNWMLLLIPLGPLFLIIVGLSTVAKVGKLKNAIARFDASKNEESAIFLYNELITTNGLHMFFFKAAASQTHPIPTQKWTFVFNKLVNPCENVTLETKKDIKNCLISFGAYGLDEVDEHKYITGDELGKLSEENVWFTLSQITSRGKYNVFSNIRMPYNSVSQKSQQIDNIIVCRKGVFLIEVKSIGGVAQSHSQQIGMHEAAFLQNFTNIAYKNLLVISCPRGQQTFINAADLPTSSLYAALTVDNLYEYIITYNGPDVLDDITIDRISQTLKTFINYEDNVPLTKWIIDGVEGKASSAESKKFCSACGKQLNSNALFCPYCGKKM